jgi:hypothetical protein
MNEAQDAVNAALAQLADIDEVVSAAVTAEDPRAAWQTAKTEFLAIKESIRSAHQSLREAVAALKAAIAEAQAGNSTSETTDNNADDETTDTETE